MAKKPFEIPTKKKKILRELISNNVFCDAVALHQQRHVTVFVGHYIFAFHNSKNLHLGSVLEPFPNGDFVNPVYTTKEVANMEYTRVECSTRVEVSPGLDS